MVSVLSEASLGGFSTAHLRRVPPEALLRRGEWSLCAMEHSRMGPVEFQEAGALFHHLALPLERVPLRLGLKMDGRLQFGRNARDMLTTIEAGVGGTAMWDGPYESACLYFTSSALTFALGCKESEAGEAVRTRAKLCSPVLVRLLHALHADALAGQPHRSLIGDAIFIALAARLVPRGKHRRELQRRSEPWRVRRALEHIHTSLVEPLDIAAISAAAGTSPFYLNHVFRATLGCSIWQYVLRERARYAVVLMHDRALNLAGIAQLAGFDTYASFIAATRGEFGATPARLRASAGG